MDFEKILFWFSIVYLVRNVIFTVFTMGSDTIKILIKEMDVAVLKGLNWKGYGMAIIHF